jgi:hypothetical protein
LSLKITFGKGYMTLGFLLDISKFINSEDMIEEINCNIDVKQGCPLSLTIFGIYIDKLVDFLEEVGCVGMKIA